MKVLAAGDSHTKFFGITPAVRVVYPMVRDVRADVLPVNGATVAGVGRMNSTLQFMESLRERLKASAADVCVINLGQVDVELGTPYRKYVKQDRSRPIEYLNEVVEKYVEVISQLRADFPEINFIVKGANAPVLIYDSRKTIADVGNVVTERISSVDVEQRQAILERIRGAYESDAERHALTISFNDLLRAASGPAGVHYFDINHDITDDSGFVHPSFIPNAMDHHFVDSVEIRAIHWRNLMRTLGLERGK